MKHGFMAVVAATELDCRLAVTEGTWMSVDVSPDGATTVFDRVGDIFTMAVSWGLMATATSSSALADWNNARAHP